ncbi:MAG: hypothetical protein C4547_03790 [Phycisphaerales bacterium]|nr:MAG: hypothetical protein C4547_03790 [Phycisphaerales bacterium]
MDEIVSKLIGLAAVIGVTHTALGPDHYVPFIAMSQAGRWSFRRTLLVVWACGLAHVLSSFVIGTAGIAFGWALGSMEAFEAARGGLAGWLLLGFGTAYLVWGIRKALRNKPHAHLHVHGDGTVHSHVHTHHGEHVHMHVPAAALDGPHGGDAALQPKMTGWILFTIFVFGPCEPLIPLLMVPAAEHAWWAIASVAAVFAVATISTMTALVAAGRLGLSRWQLPGLERYTYALAGLALVLCGVAIRLGL